MEGDAEAGARGGGDAGAVGQAPDVVDAEAFEEIVEAGGDFHVGAAVHRLIGALDREAI